MGALECANAIRAVRDKTARIINLKIMKSGVREAQRIWSVARGGGVSLMIGGMLESEVAMGTSLQLAAGAGGIEFFDLDTPFFLQERTTKQSPWHAQSATLVTPFTLGHGMELL